MRDTSAHVLSSVLVYKWVGWHHLDCSPGVRAGRKQATRLLHAGLLATIFYSTWVSPTPPRQLLQLGSYSLTQKGVSQNEGRVSYGCVVSIAYLDVGYLSCPRGCSPLSQVLSSPACMFTQYTGGSLHAKSGNQSGLAAACAELCPGGTGRCQVPSL